MADLSGERLGKYALIERIGRGGMADVYRALADDADDETAIKVLTLDEDNTDSDIFLARFESEIRIIAGLNHPHLLPIQDYGRDGDYVYLVTRLIGGGTLADLIRRGPLDIEAACYWLLQVASALDHAHQNHVIHRDLKPSNVLLDEAGNAYLTDFGIARLTSHTSGLTQTGNVIGTPAYMAPEQWRDEQLDARTDVYGLAVMTYLMLTTHTPFESETAHGMMYQHLHQKPPSLGAHLPEVSRAVDEVVLKALAKIPIQRYRSAGEFAGDFQAALQGRPTLAESAPDPTPARNPVNAVAPAIPSALPPPVYGPYRTSYPIPDHLRRHNRGLPRWVLWSFIGGSTLMSFIIFFIGLVLVLDSSNAIGPTTRPSATLTPSPIVTPNERPLDVPRIRIDNPVGDVTVNLGETVVIAVVAFDNEGVTRIEMRRFGMTLQAVVSQNPNGDSPFAAEMAYMPDTTGRHRLELVALRGDLEGESRFVTISVQ